MTFASRLTSAQGRDIRYRVSIDGIEGFITSQATGSAGGLIDGRGAIVSIEESPTRLDIYRRRQVGGGCVIKILDTDDGNLANSFAPRVRRFAWVTGNVSKTATTIPVNTSGFLPSPGTIYIGAETITYTGTTTTSFTGCTRGAHGSPAQSHRGGTENGASVFTLPPRWYGRRVRMQGFFLDDEGQPDMATLETLGVFRLEEAPTTEGDGVWELRCSHLSDELAQRKLGAGIKEIDTPGSLAKVVEVSGERVIEIITVPGVARLMTQSSTVTTQALVEFAGSTDTRAIFDVVSAEVDQPTAGTDRIRLRATPLTSRGLDAVNLARLFTVAGDGFGADARVEVKSIKHIALLQGAPTRTLMQMALISRLGDGANGSLDILPGVEPVEFEDEGFRVGAGILAAEIDDTSLGNVAGLVPASWAFPIDGEVPATDLVDAFTLATGSAAIYTRDGKLAFPLLRGERRDVSLSIARPGAVLGPVGVRVEEHHVFPRARLECNYNPVTGEYEGSIDVVDEEMARLFADTEQQLVVQDRSIVVDPLDTSGEGTWVRPARQFSELLPFLRRAMVNSRGGPLILDMRLDAAAMLLELGDLVDISLPDVPDFRGGRLTSARGRVIEREPQWMGSDALTIRVQVLIEERLFHFAPVFYVDTVVDEGSDIHLLTATIPAYPGFTEDPGESPSRAQSFRVGDQPAAYVPGTGVLRDFVDSITQIVSTSQMRVQASGAAVPQPGDILFMTTASSASVASADGFFVSDYQTPGLTRWR